MFGRADQVEPPGQDRLPIRHPPGDQAPHALSSECLQCLLCTRRMKRWEDNRPSVASYAVPTKATARSDSCRTLRRCGSRRNGSHASSRPRVVGTTGVVLVGERYGQPSRRIGGRDASPAGPSWSHHRGRAGPLAELGAPGRPLVVAEAAGQPGRGRRGVVGGEPSGRDSFMSSARPEGTACATARSCRGSRSAGTGPSP